MIVGLGTDMVEIERIAESLRRFSSRFCHRVLGPEELALFPASLHRQAFFIAGRFAAKEATVKALGTGFSQGIAMRHIEVLNLPSGQPCLQLGGAAAQRAQEMGATRFHISLSHEKSMALAVVILEQ